MKKRIHVNQHNIKKNRKEGTNLPVITVKTYKDNRYGHEVEILGESKVIYRPDKPLPCGAQVWIETNAEVLLDGKPETEEVSRSKTKRKDDSVDVTKRRVSDRIAGTSIWPEAVQTK